MVQQHFRAPVAADHATALRPGFHGKPHFHCCPQYVATHLQPHFFSAARMLIFFLISEKTLFLQKKFSKYHFSFFVNF